MELLEAPGIIDEVSSMISKQLHLSVYCVKSGWNTFSLLSAFSDPGEGKSIYP